MRSLVMLASVLLITSSVGHAQTPSARVVELYELADTLFRADRYEEAGSLLEEALRIEPHSILAFNLARTYERLERPLDAARAYEQYLELDPRAPDTAEVRGLIETLRTQRDPAIPEGSAQLDPAQAGPGRSRSEPSGVELDPPEESASATQDRGSLVPPIATLALGAVVGVSAGLTWFGAQNARETYDALETTRAEATIAQERAVRRQRATRGLLGATVCVGVAGVVWLIVRLTRRSSDERAANEVAFGAIHF